MESRDYEGFTAFMELKMAEAVDEQPEITCSGGISLPTLAGGVNNGD